MKKVHFGCGTNILKGWENVDFPKVDVRKRLPYKDSSIDFIFHEHLLEHLSETDGLKFMKETYRILKPSGILRISCPSIDGIVWVYQNWGKIPPSPWKNDKHSGNPNKFINNAVVLPSLAGYHRNLDDKKSIKEKLISFGFRDVEFVKKHKSKHVDLRNLEKRFGGKYKDFPPQLDITLEAQK